MELEKSTLHTISCSLLKGSCVEASYLACLPSSCSQDCVESTDRALSDTFLLSADAHVIATSDTLGATASLT